MKMNDFADLPVIDSHVHFWFGDNPGMAELDNYEKLLLEVMKRGRLSGICLTADGAGLYLKKKHPPLFYAGAGVPWSGSGQTQPPDWNTLLAIQMKAGCDGIGEMGSKPAARSKFQPLSGDYYKGFWAYCLANKIPIQCHVADPEEFWDATLALQWAKDMQWTYDGDFPAKEELYKDMEKVLTGIKGTPVVLAHFYFLSGDIRRAADFLEKNPTVEFDLAPGVEFMYNMSQRRNEWRKFIIRYQDRILFGTDIMPGQDVQQALDRIWLLRNFLESNEEFYTPDTADKLVTRYDKPFTGLDLPKAVLKNIYAENFKRVFRAGPKPVDVPSAIQYCNASGKKFLAEAFGKL